MNFNPEDIKKIFSFKRAKVVGYNLMASCPFGTHEDIHPSFGISLDSGRWNCYSCGERGSNIRTLAYKMRILLPDDIMLQSLSLVPVERVGKGPEVYSGLVGLSENVGGAYSKLKSRGISLAALKRFRVGFREGTVIFPCVLPRDKLCGWIERNELWDGRYGYKPSGVNRKYLLFGLDRVYDRVYLVESMTDMLRLVSWHYPAVSTCGNRIFEEQAKLLLTHCAEIVLVPQNDRAAKVWIKNAEESFKGKVKVFGIAISNGYKDVCSKGYGRSLWEVDQKKIRFLY
jgi:hypothetical protein